jgi:hypothetical protein
MERMSIATWIVCGRVIAERMTNSAAKFPFGKKLNRLRLDY